MNGALFSAPMASHFDAKGRVNANYSRALNEQASIGEHARIVADDVEPLDKRALIAAHGLLGLG